MFRVPVRAGIYFTCGVFVVAWLGGWGGGEGGCEGLIFRVKKAITSKGKRHESTVVAR